MTVDIHVHTPRLVMSCSSPGELREAFGRMLLAGHRAGIDTQVVLGLWGDNDAVRELAQTFPGEVVAFASVSGTDPEGPAKLEWYVEEWGFRGLKLHQERHLPLTGLLACHPLFAKAAKLGIPVLIHTWHLEEGLPTPLPHDYGTVGLPVASMAELGRMHPSTTFVLAHAGGIWEKAFQAVAPYPNIHVDVSGFDPERGVVEKAVETLGAERVLFGSDAPGRSYAAQIAKVKYADIGEKERQLILGGNAVRLLDLR